MLCLHKSCIINQLRDQWFGTGQDTPWARPGADGHTIKTWLRHAPGRSRIRRFMPVPLPLRGCTYCLRTFRPRRSWQQFCGRACRKSASREQLRAEYVCTYCGLAGETIDHVPPTSIRPVLVQLGLDADYPFMTVRACHECNSILGDIALWTIEQRRTHIAERLSRRYRKYLDIPHWSQTELDALGDTLRQMTLHGIAVREVTRYRLTYAGSHVPPVDRTPAPAMPVRVMAIEATTICACCQRPTQNDEFCSLLCEHIATGCYPRTHFSKRSIRATLRLLSPLQRRQFKIRRLERAVK